MKKGLTVGPIQISLSFSMLAILRWCIVIVLVVAETELEEMAGLLNAWNATAETPPNATCFVSVDGQPGGGSPLVQKARKFSSVSVSRLEATYALAKAALRVPGDFVETGLFTGGSASVMIGVLASFDSCNRTFYGFDSFQGFPDPSDEDHAGISNHGTRGQFIAKRSEFEANLASVGINVNDTRLIRISQGWFNDTCPTAPIETISFLRMDGDLFVSTWDALAALYPKVSPGGLIYVDDVGSFNGCRHAVNKYRTLHKIWEPMHFVREEKGPRQRKMVFEAVWWRKRGLRDG